jgi:SAM-dependent methyltransferase
MDSTQRFSDRVGDYIKYRPHYPAVLLSWLTNELALDASRIVGDIGSGTGILTELFLRNGNRVLAVEPNEAMRSAAERLLSGYPGFVSADGTAEATGLPDAGIDLIVAGQAFHWFDPEKTRLEFVRIARPEASVALIWNERLVLSDLEKEYEALILAAGGDYKTINHKNIADLQIGAFFHPQPFMLTIFENEQVFDLEGLTGRLLSSSYIPKEGSGYDPMMRELEAIFARHQTDGKVRVGYETKMYTGRIK